MPTLGQNLRQARQKQGRSLADIATSTCISSRYLQAIEADDFKELPGGVFARSFIRQYGAALEIDPTLLERDILSALPLDEPDPLLVLSESYQAARVSKPARGLNTTWLVVLLFAAIAGSSGFFAWWQRLQTPPEEASQRLAAPLKVAAAEAPPKEPATKEVEVPVAAPAVAVSAPTEPPAVIAPLIPEMETPPLDATKVNLQLQAKERTWVSLSAAGKTLFAGVLDRDELKQLPGLQNAKLVTANAGGLEVRFNGKPLGSLGPRGRALTILFTPDSYEVVPTAPKKVSAPAMDVQRRAGLG